jgi:hypothetical protein
MRRVDRRLAAALALAAVLAGATCVARFTAALPLARVLACAVVRWQLGQIGLLFFFSPVGNLRTREQSARDAQHHLSKVATIHGHDQSPL